MSKLRTRIRPRSTDTKKDYHERIQGVRMQSLFNRRPGVCVQAVNLINNNGPILRFAHDYIPMPSTSDCAVQNDARKAALAGRVLTDTEIKAGADLRRARPTKHNRKLLGLQLAG